MRSTRDSRKDKPIVYTYFDPMRPEGQAERIREWDMHFTALGYATKLLTIRHALRDRRFRQMSWGHKLLWAPIFALKAVKGGNYSHECYLGKPGVVTVTDLNRAIGILHRGLGKNLRTKRIMNIPKEYKKRWFAKHLDGNPL